MRLATLLAAATVIGGCAKAGGPGGAGGVPLRSAARGVVVLGGTDRYAVTGRTIAEISRSLRAAGQREGGFAGHYSSTFRWSYRYVSSATSSACRMADFRIEVLSTIRIPDWKRASDAPLELVQRWAAFFNNLMDHERQDERIALEAAAELSRTFQRMSAMSCGDLGREANREGERQLEQMRLRQGRYDEETRHGATTGAVWPPQAPVRME